MMALIVGHNASNLATVEPTYNTNISLEIGQTQVDFQIVLQVIVLPVKWEVTIMTSVRRRGGGRSGGCRLRLSLL